MMLRLALGVAATTGGAAAVSHVAPARAASPQFEGEQRIYFQLWNVGQQCSANPSCRDAATSYLTNTSSFAFQTSEAAVFATTNLLAANSEAVDLTQHGQLEGKSYQQVDGLCHGGQKFGSSAVSLTFRPGWSVLKKDSGCLSKEGVLEKTEPHAFVAALLKPPKANGMLGGIVKNCEAGVCMVALSVPKDGIAQGADKIAAVCGEARHQCAIALGDFGADTGSYHNPSKSVLGNWKQLIGDKSPQVYINGVVHANLASNIPGLGPGMNVGQGFPLAKQFGNGTKGGSASQAYLIDQLIPCKYPGFGANDGCKQ
jgi:hypothetical protein